MRNVRGFSHTTWAGSVDGRPVSLRADVGVRLIGRLSGQRLPSYNFHSRADVSIYPEDYRGLRGDFDFRAVDAQNYG